MIKLKPEYIMSAEDREILASLPDADPEVKWKPAQILQVTKLYKKYINVEYGFSFLYEIEQKEKWYGGKKVKDHEAFKIILDFLANFKPELTLIQFAHLCYGALRSRKSYRLLLWEVYDTIELSQEYYAQSR